MFGIRLCQKTSTPCEPKRTPSGLETDVLTGGFATLLLSVSAGGMQTWAGCSVAVLALLCLRSQEVLQRSFCLFGWKQTSLPEVLQRSFWLFRLLCIRRNIDAKRPRHGCFGDDDDDDDSFPSPLPCFVLPCFALRFRCIALLCVSFALRCFAVFCIWIAMFSRALLCVSFALLCFAFPLLCVALLCLALPCSALRCCDFLCFAFRGAHRSGTEVSQRCAAWARLTFHWVPGCATLC